MKTRFAGLAVALVLSHIISSSTIVVAAERMDLLGTSAHSSSALSGAAANTSAKSSKGEISPMALQFANKLGVLPGLQRLQLMRSHGASDASSSLEMLSLKQELLESTVIAAQELRAVVARVNSEDADTSELHAHLAERRDRAVRINTYANLISGGITGMVGGGLSLGSVNHLAPDLIDTTEGVIQTSLATWALSQQRGESRMMRGTPSLLSHLMNRSSELEDDFPPSVWCYLQLPIHGGKDTIISTLVDRWFLLNLCLKHSGHRESRASRQIRIANAPNKNSKVSIDVLEDRMAMLSDLRACVQQMDYLVLELMQTVHGTKTVPHSI